MAEIQYILKKHYAKCFDSLKNTSHDKENDIYMCGSKKEVVNFDELTRMLYPIKQPSSYDALLIEEAEKKIFYIEFKNQTEAKIVNKSLHKKVIDSDETLKKLCTSHHIAKKSYTTKLCVIYKTKSQFRYRRFQENIVHFGLEQFTGKYFDTVITNNINFFTKEFLNR